MRFCVINQFYPPDLAPTGHLASAVAVHRAGMGDEVTVITGTGSYLGAPSGEKDRTGPNPRILRLWTPGLGKHTLLHRTIDYLTFTATATLRLLVLPPQDLILSLTTPPMIVASALLHRALRGRTRVILWNMDCYPEVLERARVIQPGGPMSRILRLLNRIMFRRLDHVVALDHAMENVLRREYGQGGPPAPITVIPNWEPLSEFPADARPSLWPPAKGFQLDDRFVVLYLGNAGYGHQFRTVLNAADRTRDGPFAFIFVGGGERWAELEASAMSMGLRHFHIHGYVPKSATPSVMATADCALITLRDGYAGVISPSKLHGYLAMGLPILYIGPADTNVDEAISRFACGVSLREGDVDGAVEFLRQIQEQPATHQAFRSRARHAFEVAYSDRVALPQLDSVIEAVIGGGASPLSTREGASISV